MGRKGAAALIFGLGIIGAAALWAGDPRGAPRPDAPWSDPISSQRRQAVDRAYRWLAARATNAPVIAAHGSDFLQVFYELKTSAASPKLRQRAAEDGAIVARRCIAYLSKLEEGGLPEVFEAVALLGLAKDFDMKAAAQPVRAKAERWRARFTDSDLYGVEAGVEARSIDELCDALIGQHFLRRAGFEDKGALAWALKLCADHRYVEARELSEDELMAQDNLMTHVVYALSDYGRLSLDRRRFAPEIAYARRSMKRCREADDIEGVAEFTDSLRILGVSDRDEDMAANLRWLLDRQNPDGSFGREDGHFYERYHSTWTALNALRGFRFQGEGPLWKEWESLRPIKAD